MSFTLSRGHLCGLKAISSSRKCHLLEACCYTDLLFSIECGRSTSMCGKDGLSDVSAQCLSNRRGLQVERLRVSRHRDKLWMKL